MKKNFFIKISIPWLVLALAVPLVVTDLATVNPVKAADDEEVCPTCQLPGPKTVAMIIHASPEDGGTVSLSDNGTELEPTGDVFNVLADSFDIVIAATPASGYRFVGWDGEEDTINPVERPLSNPFKVRAKPIELAAVFAPESAEYASHDGALEVTIPYGTYALDKNEAPITKMNFTILNDPPQADGTEVIGHAYRVEPAGATFSPAVTMTWSLDPADIPDGVTPEDLTIAYYDESRKQWVILDSEIDTREDTISAPIDHLSIYAVLAPGAATLPSEVLPPETTFNLGGLNIHTQEAASADPATSVTVSPDRTVYIDVLVKNTTDTAGSYTVTLNIDGVAEKHRKVTLASGAFTVVTFETTRSQAGTYAVVIDGLDDEGSFTVVSASPESQIAPVSPSGPATNTPVSSAGARAKVLVPLLVAIFFAIYIPIKIRRSRDWY